jgi:hypothetical protein
MVESKRWIVTASDGRDLKGIAGDLRQAGFQVDDILEPTGCITGSATHEVMEILDSIPGVVDVTAEDAVEVEPRDPSVAW